MENKEKRAEIFENPKEKELRVVACGKSSWRLNMPMRKLSQSVRCFK